VPLWQSEREAEQRRRGPVPHLLQRDGAENLRAGAGRSFGKLRHQLDGFNVSSTGTGAKTYNVGSNGSAIGLANNTSYTVSRLLQAANANCSGGTIAAGAFNALNNIFDGINSSGDIH
jgi:hypothetical protein